MTRSRGIPGSIRLSLAVGGVLTAAATVLAAPATAQNGPAGCVVLGTAQLPPGAPAGGGRLGLTNLPEFRGTNAPTSVELRTPTTQFNKFWDFALVGHDLLARPRGTTEPWRYAPLPGCRQGKLVGISVDDDELVGVDGNGWLYTMDNVTQDPWTWNWTSAWGAPFWLGTGHQLVGTWPGGWALSVSSPSANQTFADAAGRIHLVGAAKMTMVPALTGDGSRIVYADPWLPNDRSYEIGGPLGGRFQSTSLSSSASTTFVMNRYGDMYTRDFDFDSSGSDSVFFSYTWDRNPNPPVGRDGSAAIQLPAPDWVRQPKVPGEITSAISVHSTGVGPGLRELRVEGRHDGVTGFWHKALSAPAWEFTPTGADLLGGGIENSPRDRSAETLAPPVPWNLSATLPARNTPIDGELLANIGLPYSVVDPRILDSVGATAAPSGYVLEVNAFDPAASTRDATVVAPDGTRIPVLLHTADGMRMTPRGPGLDGEPRHLIGAIETAPGASGPAVDAFTRDWMRGRAIAPITLSATDHDLVVR